MKKTVLKIGGMSCSACSNGLEKYLNKQEGIYSVNVNLVMANALIEFEEKILTIKKIEKLIKEAGYESLGIYQEKKEEKGNQAKTRNFILFSILSVFFLYVSMGMMTGLPEIPLLSMHQQPRNYAISLFVLTIPYLIYGQDILKSGYRNLMHKTPNMDTLVAIGVISSFLYSTFGMVMILKGDHHYVENLYFESAAIVIFFIKLGRYLEGMSKDKTKEAIQNLVQITPNTAKIKIEGKEKEITIDEVKKGDILIAQPGDRIAVDGEITEGKAYLEEAFITGESKPISKTIGDKVMAGSRNQNGYLVYRAEKIGKESTISEIVRIVIEATTSKAPIAKVADQISGYFVPIIILIAVATFIGYLLFGFSVAEALNTFVTILVVACPCSLGLATPLAIIVSEGTCAKQGILVKKSEILENAMKMDTIVFDKTGTLTYGKLKLAEIINQSNLSEKELLQIIGSVETKSNHPIAKAFSNYLEENKILTQEVTQWEEKSGYGVLAEIEEKQIAIGNHKLVEKLGIENPFKKEEIKQAEEGNSIVYVVIDQKVVALIGVNDVVRESAKTVIQKLKQRKIETIMLTGDHQKTANKIAQEIGIENVISDVLPTEKGKVIQELQKQNKKVMMIGDGINDSPALATSNVGVSIHGATDIAMDSADVILMKNDLNKILDLIQISQKTIKNIKQNLFWAFFYNTLMIPIAIGILKPIGIQINPMIAGIAMTISSFTVILNALRLRKIPLEGGK